MGMQRITPLHLCAGLDPGGQLGSHPQVESCHREREIRVNERFIASADDTDLSADWIAVGTATSERSGGPQTKSRRFASAPGRRGA